MKLLDKLLHFTSKKNIDDIKFQDLEKYECVSFDIFDTLLKRDVFKPTDIFSIMEKKVGDEFPNFKEQRIRAERLARLSDRNGEVTLEKIYLSINGLSQEKIDKYIELEKETEFKFLRANIDILPLFNYCIKNNKRIILISDMYLSKEFICKVLEREGIDGYTSIFVSSEYNKTKSSGNLFQYIYENEKIEKKRWLHIGDSYHSDFQVPRRLGIDAICIPTFNKKLSYMPEKRVRYDINSNILYNFLNNRISNDFTNYYRFGFEKFGPFLWGYVSWLKKSFDQKGIKKVFFFSRDGLIMKKAFDLLFSQSDITSEYLEVSRRSLRVPILYIDSSLKCLIDMISPSKLISLKMIFDGIGLDIDNYSGLIAEFDYSENKEFNRASLLNDKKFAAFYNRLRDDIVENSKNEYKFLKQFLIQKKISGKFAIVDIGWSGGMQRYLIETLNKLKIENQVMGFYCGVAEYCKRNLRYNSSLKLFGYLFDFSHNSHEIDKRKPFVGLFETLFLEQAGSVRGYMINSGGKSEAIRSKYEYLNDDGTPTFELEAVREIQKGALDFISTVSSVSYLDANNFTSDELFAGLKETGLNPSSRELKMFAKFRFFDEGLVNELASPKSVIYYVSHPKHFKSDFLLSRWKIGFLKGILKLPLPYEKIYNFLYKFK